MNTPYELWEQARRECASTSDADDRGRWIRVRYLQLMREHGHIVKAKPGEDRNLPCGWPGERRPEESP